MTTCQHDAREDDAAAKIERETAPTSRFRLALEAFETVWSASMAAHDDTFALWEPDVDADVPSIGIARPGAEYGDVVRITMSDADMEAVLDAAATGQRIDLARAASMLSMNASEVRTAIMAATAGLRAAHNAGR